MDPSHAPNMTLSIGGIGLNTEILHGNGAMVIKPSQDIAQNPQWDVCNNSSGLKRKRGKSDTLPRTEISSLSFPNDGASGPSLGLCSVRPSPCNSSFSTGSRTSTGTMFMQGIVDEGPLMSLGLGFTGLSSHNGRVTSSISGGGGSMLTSVDTSIRQFANMNSEPGNGASVLLGLGPSQCHSINIKNTAGERKGFKAANANLFGSDLGMQLQLGLSRSSVVVSDDERMSCMSLDQGNGVVFHDTTGICNELNVVADDEGSTSARTIKAGGYMPSLVMTRRLDGAPCFETETEEQRFQGERDLEHQACNGDLYTNKERKLDDLFMNLKTSSVTTSTSGQSASADRTSKTCKFQGCGKGARGASGLCITHGGGRRCQRQGCNKGAEGRTVYCKSHGGGRRCQSLGCTKSAEGKTDYCIGHGGGRRCSHDGCSKAARGRSGLCIRHGGGKRCQKEGCTKSAEGYSGLCISHGGGRRCQAEGCGKGAQGSTLFCKAHGGGKRCMIQGCTKGAEGSTPLCKGHGGGKRCMFDGGGICTKSVHGGTSFCVAHGGGKRCAMEGCTKSARGRTSFCVRHGGGKRCKFNNCTKSAQGSTEFCKAHGGGKRCSWGQEGSPYSEFIKDKSGELFKGPCDRFARGKIGLCAAHSALVQDRRVHGAGTVGSALPAGIGPGLFRGLVPGLTFKGNHLESASDASKQSTHGSEEQEEHGSESGGSDSIQNSGANGRPSQGEAASMEDVSCHAQGLPQPSLGYYPSFTFTGNNFNVFQKETQSLNKMNGGVLIANSGATSLWPGISTQGESKAPDFFTPSVLTVSNNVAVSALKNQSIREGIVFRRSLLPPQVLVPLSMQKGEFLPSHGKGSVKHTRISNASGDNGIIDTSVHEERVHGGSAHEERAHGGSVREERVHGGDVLALLSENKYQKNS